MGGVQTKFGHIHVHRAELIQIEPLTTPTHPLLAEERRTLRIPSDEGGKNRHSGNVNTSRTNAALKSKMSLVVSYKRLRAGRPREAMSTPSMST